MPNYFLKVTCDVFCTWSKHVPRYRAYVNDELFTERTWTYSNMYLEETFQILAPPGKYQVRYELLDGKRAELVAKNWRLEVSEDIKHLVEISQTGALEIKHALA